MTREEVIKQLRRELDDTRISAKLARKRHDQLSEKYEAGKSDALLSAIYWVEQVEVQP